MEEVISAISQERIPYAAVMFVDDTDLPIIGQQGEDSAGIWARAQEKLEVWQKGLWVMGGI